MPAPAISPTPFFGVSRLPPPFPSLRSWLLPAPTLQGLLHADSYGLFDFTIAHLSLSLPFRCRTAFTSSFTTGSTGRFLLTIAAIFLAVFPIGRLAIFLTSADSAGSEASQSSSKTLASSLITDASRKIIPISRRSPNSTWRRLWFPKKTSPRSRIMVRVCSRMRLSLLKPHLGALSRGLFAVIGEGVVNLIEPWPLKIVLDDV